MEELSLPWSSAAHSRASKHLPRCPPPPVLHSQEIRPPTCCKLQLRCGIISNLSLKMSTVARNNVRSIRCNFLPRHHFAGIRVCCSPATQKNTFWRGKSSHRLLCSFMHSFITPLLGSLHVKCCRRLIRRGLNWPRVWLPRALPGLYLKN